MTNTEKKIHKLKCYECEKLIDVRYALQDEDEYYCLDCWLEKYDNKLLIDYSYKPQPRFSKMSFEKNPLFMGIELEMEADEAKINQYDYDADEDEDGDEEREYYNQRYLADYAYNIMKKYPCYIKYDGSLNNSGMEIVTHPQTVKFHKCIFDWETLFKKLQRDGFTSYSNNRCGLHIHLSKSWFKPEDYLKFNIIFDKNFSILKRFSKRTKVNYCNKINSRETRIIEREKKKTRLSDWYDHYKSIYFGNYKTIELRIFRGTLDITRFNATLDMTEALSLFVKSYSLVFFIKATRKQLWYTFLSFMQQCKRYDKLLKYLQKEKLLFCKLKNIPKQGILLNSLVEKKDLISLMGNADIKSYLQYKVLDKLEYYFDDFEDYQINQRSDVYYLRDNSFIPINFEKIVMYNNRYNARKREMLLNFFFDYGFTIELQNKNMTTKIKNSSELAKFLGIDLIEIRRERERKEKVIAKHRTPQHEQFLLTYLSNTDIDDCHSWEVNKIHKLILEGLAKRSNSHLKFIIKNTNI